MNYIERLRQHLGKASFSSEADRFSALECLSEIERAGEMLIEVLLQHKRTINVSPPATESGTPQYYYKDNACKANSAHDEDCICWHDKGTGPLPDTVYAPRFWRRTQT